MFNVHRQKLEDVSARRLIFMGAELLLNAGLKPSQIVGMSPSANPYGIAKHLMKVGPG